MQTIGARLQWARKQRGLTQEQLAKLSSVGLSTIRRIEQEQGGFTPQLGKLEQLASALHLRSGWLGFGEPPMVWLWQMTGNDQIKEQTGPGTEGLPGFVVIDGGPWYWDVDEWRVDGVKPRKTKSECTSYTQPKLRIRRSHRMTREYGTGNIRKRSDGRW